MIIFRIFGVKFKQVIMTKDEMHKFIRDEYPITDKSVRVIYNHNVKDDIGFFTENPEDINEHNKWRFVSDPMSSKYRDSGQSDKYTTIINGDTVKKLIKLK